MEAGKIREALTFDDVLLMPQYSVVRPREVDLTTRLTRNIGLKIPIVSAPMDTVTESAMAIQLALQGGIGIIHKNLTPEEQAREVETVKRFENGFIQNPVTLSPDDDIEQADDIRMRLGYKKIPIVDEQRRLVGLLTEQDYFVPEDGKAKVSEKMRSVKEIVTVTDDVDLLKANKVIREQKLSVLCVVDKGGRLKSIVTRRDLEKNEEYPFSNKDDSKRLRVGAAVSVGEGAIKRGHMLAEAGVDVLVPDVAHGDSEGVAETVRRLKKELPHVDVIGGSVATAAGAEMLAEAGADALRVGVGPGSICSTRVVAGIGVPQLTAVMEAVAGVKKSGKDIPVIADGGIRASGDIVKALAAGAESIMTGRLFAATDEAPGQVEVIDGVRYKVYRGMGSHEAMKRGSADRYGHTSQEMSEGEGTQHAVAAEGVVGRVPYVGSMVPRLHELLGGIRSGCSFIGAGTVPEMAKQAEFVRITGAGLTESRPHSIKY